MELEHEKKKAASTGFWGFVGNVLGWIFGIK